MKKLLLVLVLLFLAGCAIPDEIVKSIDGNAKTASEFAELSKLIDCTDAVEIAEFWATHKCAECGSPEEEKAHQKAKLTANALRAMKLKEWAEKNK